ncbi:MAG: 4'-phosphopantetheinyl transferase superfamily protein [Gammaproteobacteria bacterium]|nr:4'-phosphopantetheinyl transferase superfamily protein [Gammaproteobacteria bacterium]NNJ85231.1 4'-phosphopantetheinyl transferase superfamily protein [Gammaproteobacteria bacterium]
MSQNAATHPPCCPSWHPPPDDPMLPDNEVHIWRARLDPPEAVVESLRGFLAEDELRRVARFHFPAHRRHFTVARGTLRMLIGRYLHESPEKIHFAYNRYGKPFLAFNSFRFNLSHAGEMVLYAFVRNREIGIDIEWMARRLDDGESIVKRFFSPREVETFLELPAPFRKTAFFNGWTRKEAYIKARGKGLSIPLDQFDIMPGRGRACLVTTRGDPREAPPRTTRWMMETLTPEADYIATLMVAGQPCPVVYWQIGADDFICEPKARRSDTTPGIGQ